MHTPTQGSANFGPQAMSCPPPDVSKVFWEHSHAHSRGYCLWLMWQYNRTAGLLNSDQLACTVQNIYYLAFYKESLPTLP